METTTSSRPVLYTRRAPRWMHFVALVATVALVSSIVFIVFFSDGEIEGLARADEFDVGAKVLAGAIAVVGVFFTGVSAYRLVRNPPYFVMYEDGFEYSPGGVSTGLIKWCDVQELREETVVHGDGNAVREQRPVTAVVLRDPKKYLQRFPAALRPLFELRMKMNSSPILIERGQFGRDHDAVMTIMREQVARASSPS